MRVVLRGSRISDTHFPPLHRIPLYKGCFLVDEDDAEEEVKEAMTELHDKQKKKKLMNLF